MGAVAQQHPAGGHRQRLLDGAMVCLREKGYARTTARDLVSASQTNLHSIGYHFGSKDALLHEALAQCFDDWTARVEEAVFAPLAEGAGADPRELLERALVALIDAFDEMRPEIHACVEAYAPAVRSEELRGRLAGIYARTRRRGAEMVRRSCAELGVEPPFDPAAFSSVLTALADGLMLQWLADPDETPDAHQVLDVLTGLSWFLIPRDAPEA